jgi:hypothetical protein
VPIFPYLPVIVWRGIIKVALGATRDLDAPRITDPAHPDVKPREHHPFSFATQSVLAELIFLSA